MITPFNNLVERQPRSQVHNHLGHALHKLPRVVSLLEIPALCHFPTSSRSHSSCSVSPAPSTCGGDVSPRLEPANPFVPAPPTLLPAAEPCKHHPEFQWFMEGTCGATARCLWNARVPCFIFKDFACESGVPTHNLTFYMFKEHVRWL